MVSTQRLDVMVPAHFIKIVLAQKSPTNISHMYALWKKKTQGELQKGFSKKRSEVNPSYKKAMAVTKFGVDRTVHSRPNPRRFGFKSYVAILCVVFLFCG